MIKDMKAESVNEMITGETQLMITEQIDTRLIRSTVMRGRESPESRFWHPIVRSVIKNDLLNIKKKPGGSRKCRLLSMSQWL